MPIHEMTELEYIQSMKGKRVEHFYYNRRGQLMQNHTNAVIDAIERRISVSAHVIQSMSYPLPRHLQSRLQ